MNTERFLVAAETRTSFKDDELIVCAERIALDLRQVLVPFTSLSHGHGSR